MFYFVRNLETILPHGRPILHSPSDLGKFWLLLCVLAAPVSWLLLCVLAGTCRLFGFVLVLLFGVSRYYAMVFTRSSLITNLGFPGDTEIKNPPASAGEARDTGSFPGLGRSP